MSLSTSHSASMWSDWYANGMQPNYRKEPHMLANTEHDIYGHDTIGMVAIDVNGSIACGTTTNGAAHKIPGRVGDSPVMGAGAYCETGIGGATQTIKDKWRSNDDFPAQLCSSRIHEKW